MDPPNYHDITANKLSELIHDLPTESLDKLKDIVCGVETAIKAAIFFYQILDAEGVAAAITAVNCMSKSELVMTTAARLKVMHDRHQISDEQHRAYGSILAQNLMDLAKGQGEAIDGGSAAITRYIAGLKEREKKREQEQKEAFADLERQMLARRDAAAHEMESTEKEELPAKSPK